MKIIAIRPLAESEYLKILKPEETYYLCNNYHIDHEDKITSKSTYPAYFYSSQKVNISVQAVVGKNGSGKSSLIELLFRAVNNIAFHFQKIKIADIVKIPGLRVEFYYQTDTYYKVQIIDEAIHFFTLNKETGKIEIPIHHEEIDLRQFFYSIVVNYSHYAYNVKDLNEIKWIDGLFHKNDGYRTPLVLNPHRTDGNIDINSENHLVKSRLISNLIMQENTTYLSKMNSNLFASSLVLKASKLNKNRKILYRTSESTPRDMRFDDLLIDHEELLIALDKTYKFGYKNLDTIKYSTALTYILYKMVSIALKYYNYEETFFLTESHKFDRTKINRFLDKLSVDDSHVTLKLRQTINFLKYQHIDLKNQTLPLAKLRKIMSVIAEGPQQKNKPKLKFIDLIPPPIFQIEIWMSSDNDRRIRIPFTSLSSGEKQLAYSVSSILYHILNLESVRSNTKTRTAYRYINVVLEEIEMYAHPEMQRTYIDYIISGIEQLNLRRTRAVNLIFITHSPFILSDIPESNILFLNELGTPEPISDSLKTFGGNIHDLLTTSFFLKDGAIGAFALKKINSIIEQLNNPDLKEAASNKKEELLQNINIIAEPFLRNKLLDMYYMQFGIQKRIEQLQAELKKLQSHG